MQLEDRYYTSTEVADILGVSLRSVYRYLEDGKLVAAIKTATGRHRFTRQNILNFLYPDGAPEGVLTQNKKQDINRGEGSSMSTGMQQSYASPMNQQQSQSNYGYAQPTQSSPQQQQSLSNQYDAQPQYQPQQPQQQPQPAPQQQQNIQESQDSQQDEQVDWLSKFREAAARYKQEQDMVSTQQSSPQPSNVQQQAPAQQTPQAQPQQQQADTSFAQQYQPQQQVQPQPAQPSQPSGPQLMYYRSMLGGLKDIAQNIDKSARGSNLNYAFTLNAGASLHKPIKPFATLHAYVRSGDLDFYEKILRLTPSNKSNAQLCLIVTDDPSVFSGKEEVHGLYVVSKSQLRSDINQFGDPQLAQEISDIL